MTFDESLRALRRLQVETGSLICLGCGHEHNCGVHGCAILRMAADMIDQLHADLKGCRIDNCEFCSHHDDVSDLDCDWECLTCENPRCTCWTCEDSSQFEWRGPQKEGG